MGTEVRPYTKKDANYRRATSDDEGSCGECKFFILPKNLSRGGCQLVTGDIRAKFICNLFTPKEE